MFAVRILPNAARLSGPAFLPVIIALSIFGGANAVSAATITIGGKITQSTQDGTGPAVNNPSLNNIQTLQPYTVSIVFPGAITAPGVYNLTGSGMTFSVPAAPATEAGFNSITLTISPSGAFDVFSLLGCLTTGSGCAFGNQLDANFEIPAALLNSQNVAAIGLDQPHPLDLLEDDGVTDIHGQIATYSYTADTSAVPEPSTGALAGGVLLALISARRARAQIRRG